MKHKITATILIIALTFILTSCTSTSKNREEELLNQNEALILENENLKLELENLKSDEIVTIEILGEVGLVYYCEVENNIDMRPGFVLSLVSLFQSTPFLVYISDDIADKLEEKNYYIFTPEGGATSVNKGELMANIWDEDKINVEFLASDEPLYLISFREANLNETGMNSLSLQYKII